MEEDRLRKGGGRESEKIWKWKEEWDEEKTKKKEKLKGAIGHVVIGRQVELNQIRLPLYWSPKSIVSPASLSRTPSFLPLSLRPLSPLTNLFQLAPCHITPPSLPHVTLSSSSPLAPLCLTYSGILSSKTQGKLAGFKGFIERVGLWGRMGCWNGGGVTERRVWYDFYVPVIYALI